MKTKFKIGDLVKHIVCNECDNCCRTVIGYITEIIIDKDGIFYELNTERNVKYDENILEKVNE